MDSKDILNLSLSVAVLVATGFWVWLLWYIIKVFRSMQALVEDFRERLMAIDGILQSIQEKLTSTHTQLSFLSEGVKQLVSYFIARRASRRTSARASDSADDL